MRTYLRTAMRHKDMVRSMDSRMREHLNKMLAKFAAAARREAAGIHRIVFMMLCAKKAFERSNDEAERAFWRAYIDDLNENAARYKAEHQARKERTA